jgi:hypothetical protein
MGTDDARRAGPRKASRRKPGRGRRPDAPVCRPGDLRVAVHWDRDDAGVLTGQVIAENISRRACLLAGKPAVSPIGVDGEPLPVGTVITLELREPGYVIIAPGGRAAAQVIWSSWCGADAAGRARVSWEGGSAEAQVHGPAQPACDRGLSLDLATSWFDLIE